MNQMKIGKFIAQLRKEKNMTQRDLAEKLGVTDRAVSKWENGRGLPDISLIKPLCEELSISINELLSGERIETENIYTKSEENIINALKYTNRVLKNTKRMFLILIGIVFVILGVNIYKAKDERTVVFCQPREYTPPITLYEDEIKQAIEDYFVQWAEEQPKSHKNEKIFIAMKIYDIGENKAGTGTDSKGRKFVCGGYECYVSGISKRSNV